MGTVLYTIGHSTRAIDDFITILKSFGIEEVIDIRTIPKSRHNPQFNEQDLAHVLRNHHIGYRHMKGLGGLRHTTKDSINTAWNNASFRGFADYMQTPEYAESLNELMKIAGHKKTVIMCAEAVPWRCHRSLIADSLLQHLFKVEHIVSATSVHNHEMTSFAKVEGGKITYPG